MDRADVAGARRFTRKKHFVAERLGQKVLSLKTIYRNIAVGAATEGVIVPIMSVRSFELAANFCG
jgi:hypothetical protein